MKLAFKKRALCHLENIHRTISKDNPRAAARTIERIQASVGRLADHPFSGRPGVIAGTRFLVVPNLPYIAVYRVGGESVDILAILHTAMERRD